MTTPMRQLQPARLTKSGWSEVKCEVALHHPERLSDELARFATLGVCFTAFAEDCPENIAGQITWGGQVHLLHEVPNEDILHAQLADKLAGLFAEQLSPRHGSLTALNEAFRSPETLNPGADSEAIWRLSTTPATVLKVGNPDVIDLEVDFLSRVSEISDRVFPRIWSYGTLSDKRGYLMEAGLPDSGDPAIFLDDSRLVLRKEWLATLEGVLAPLQSLYSRTLVKRPCQVAGYHYRERIKRLLRRDDFRQTASDVGTSRDVGEVLQLPLVINGVLMPSFTTMADTASRRSSAWQSPFSTMIHGDLHLKNIVEADATGEFLFLDPRLQWDDQPIDQFGYGDPVYDLATLLHSVGGMATILQSIDCGDTIELLDASIGADRVSIQLSDSFAEVVGRVTEEFPRLCAEILPSETMEPHFKQRLFAGAANATLGWLKYKNAVRTAPAWWAIFSLGALFLHFATKKDQSNA